MNDKKVVCFLHSCTADIRGTEVLDYFLEYFKRVGLWDCLEYLFINNIGTPLDVDKYENDSAHKIIVTNYSTRTEYFEICTLRQLHFFAKFHPDYKILYLHTKGISYTKSHQWFAGISDWNDFMLYCLVNKHRECLQMLNHVDVVGCDYRNQMFYENPNHYSGNFWWTTSNYFRTLCLADMKGKYDAEFWLFRNNPTFVNIHTCPKGHYQNRYLLNEYEEIVNEKIHLVLQILEDFPKIYYGIEGNYLDVTDTCKINNTIQIPAGDTNRSILFGDPVPGTIKHISIGGIKYSYQENIHLPIRQ